MKRVQFSEQMEEFLDYIPVPLMAVDEKLNILQANALIQSITPLPKEQLSGKPIGEGLQCLHRLHRLDHPKGCGYGPSCKKCTVRKILLETFNNGTKSHKTEAALTIGGNGQEQYSTFLVSTTLVHQEQSKMCMLTFDDIHQITIREKKRQKYAEAIITTSPNAIVTLDSDNRISGWNHKAVELFHFTEEEVLTKKIDECIASHDRDIYNEAQAFSSRAHSGTRVEPTETIRYTKEGDPIHLMVSGVPIIIDGAFEGVVASYTDISRSKQKEKEIETLLQEKEHLLHEVHHRIKNHMNTISSIISLHTNNVHDPQIKGVLEDVQTKMRLMQNIYQSLYLSVDIGTVYISSFLTPLLRDIRDAYIYSQSISITTDIEDVEITSKQSLPVGIIITELITNSIKYAFPVNGQGEIHLSIHRNREKADSLCIEVSDNGKGMPPEIVEQGEYGFGLTLVNGYTVQFEGSMNISIEKGTTVRVVLELE